MILDNISIAQWAEHWAHASRIMILNRTRGANVDNIINVVLITKNFNVGS